MEKSQTQLDRDARYEEYCETYADQLRLMGYIRALESDNEEIHTTAVELATKIAEREAKRYIKINERDIKKYERMLNKMPEVPEFK